MENEENKQKIFIFIVIFIVIVIFAGWYIYRDLKGPENEALAPLAATGVDEPANTVTDSNNPPTSDVDETADEIKKKMPDLNGEIVIKASNLSEDNKLKTIANIKIIIGDLKADYDRLDQWLNLGLQRKFLGDYEGAAEAWFFAIVIRPNDAVAYHNLGDLYSQNLPDFPKAEKYYLTAIEKSPGAAFYYFKLYEFYRYFTKRPDLAENILVKGTKASTDPGLKTILEDYRAEIKQ